MEHQDRYYGAIELPDFVGELSETSLVQRLKGISQGVLPQDCVEFPIPSRFDHCYGVAYLAHLVTTFNPNVRIRTLIAAALLHDAGNPALSHLGEYFLNRELGYDGESYLRVLLEGSDTAKVLGQHGIDTELVIQFVTGKTPPMSDVLHGSIDVDNIDNVGRYWHAATQQVPFSGPALALAFHFDGQQWTLSDRAWENIRCWQNTRRSVYGLIYSEPHLGAAAMVWHAVDLASRQRQLGEQFFRSTDAAALDLLCELSSDAAYIVGLARSHQWYENVYSIETTSPTAALVELCERIDRREYIEQTVRAEVSLPDVAFCCYAGMGKDVRRVTVPFVSDVGLRSFLPSQDYPVFRLKAYLDPNSSARRDAVVKCLERLFGDAR